MKTTWTQASGSDSKPVERADSAVELEQFSSSKKLPQRGSPPPSIGKASATSKPDLISINQKTARRLAGIPHIQSAIVDALIRSESKMHFHDAARLRLVSKEFRTTVDINTDFKYARATALVIKNKCDAIEKFWNAKNYKDTRIQLEQLAPLSGAVDPKIIDRYIQRTWEETHAGQKGLLFSLVPESGNLSELQREKIMNGILRGTPHALELEFGYWHPDVETHQTYELHDISGFSPIHQKSLIDYATRSHIQHLIRPIDLRGVDGETRDRAVRYLHTTAPKQHHLVLLSFLQLPPEESEPLLQSFLQQKQLTDVPEDWLPDAMSICMQIGSAELIRRLRPYIPLQPEKAELHKKILDAFENRRGFGIALHRGYISAVREYMDLVKTLNLPADDVVKVLSAKNRKGVPGFFDTLENGNATTATVFLEGLHGFDLSKDHLIELLGAKDQAGVMGISLALHHGQAPVITALLEALVTFKLPPEDIVRLLGTKMTNGRPGFAMALQYGHLDTVTAFFEGLGRLGLPHEATVELITAACTDNAERPGFSIALLEGHATSVTAFINGVRSLLLSKDAAAKLFAAKGSDGEAGMFGAATKGHAPAVAAFVNGICDFGFSEEVVAMLLEARSHTGLPALAAAVFQNHPAVVTAIMDGIRIHKLRGKLAVDLLNAKNVNDIPGLYYALQDNKASAITAFMEGLHKLGLSDDENLEILTAPEDRGIPALAFAFDRGNADSVRAFVHGLPELRLSDQHLATLLSAKMSDGTTGLSLALEGGHTGTVAAFIEEIGKLDLSDVIVTDLLAALNGAGTPGVQLALKEGHTATVKAFINGVRALPLSDERKQQLLGGLDERLIGSAAVPVGVGLGEFGTQ